MKKVQIADRIKVGIFVMAALVIATSLIFYIGSRRQVFGSKIEISATFNNVSGLKKGNFIRYSGVIVGSVEDIKIISDSCVRVTMQIDHEAARFVKKDSKATIGTEGLLGSKYVKLTIGSTESPPIKKGDVLSVEEPIDMDALMTSIGNSGNNLESMTSNLNSITKKINNGEGTLGALITDSSMMQNVHEMIHSFGSTGKKANVLTGKMIEMTDTFKVTGENAKVAFENIKKFSQKINNDSGSIGKFFTDTSMANQVDKTLVTIDRAAQSVTSTSETVQNSWLIKLFGNKNKNKKKKKKKDP